MPGRPPVATWRKILWALFVITVVVPLAWVPGLIVTSTLLPAVLPRTWRSHEEMLILLVPVIVALLAAWLVLRSGLRRDWPGRRGQLVGWGVGAAVMAGLLAAGAVAFSKVRESSKLKSMIPRQLSAASDQYALEYGTGRIFVRYDELVGPRAYIKGYNPVDGEDMSIQFPIRIGWGNSFTVRLPNGSTVQRQEVFAAVGKSGLIATYPRPQEDNYDPQRVYLLECGIAYRGNRVVDLPPDPAGLEGRDQDGIHTYPFPDGRRWEITYRGGVPDGPFRAYYADGSPWSEATYRKGRVVEAWLITRDGKKFDELKDGDAAEAAIEAGAKAGSESSKQAGLEKVRTGDYAGAIADLSRALAINPADLGLYRSRGAARKSSGDLDGAIEDYCKAEGFSPSEAMGSSLPDPLLKLFLERGRLRQAKNDPAGATADFRVVARTLTWRAEDNIRNLSYAAAIKDLTAGIDVAPAAELHALRADARRALGEFPGAEADYTRALELGEKGVMQLPANQHVLPAHWRYQRGHVRRLLGNQAGAAEDFRAALPGLGHSALIQQTDAAFWLFLVQCEQGRKTDATAELARTDQSGWMEWNRQYARFLLGESTEAQLDEYVAANPNEDIRFRASFFNAMLRRFAGDSAGALARFQQAFKHDTDDDFAKDETRRALIQAARSAGGQKIQAGDFAGALAEFKQALFLSNPNPADLLALFADAKRGLGDREGALKNYQDALRRPSGETDGPLRSALEGKIAALEQELGPIRKAKDEAQAAARATLPPGQKTAVPTPAANRPAPPPPSPGQVKFRAHDYAGAIVEFTKTLETNPGDAEAYRNRADAKRLLGETDGAVADYTSVVEHTPERDWRRLYSLHARGHLRRLKNDLPGAAEDFRAALRVGPLSIYNCYRDSALWLYLVNRAQDQAEALQELDQTVAHGTKPSLAWNAWAGQLAGFLAGRVSEEELLKQMAAGDLRSLNARRLDALFYSAMQRQSAGDHAGALERFQQMLDIPNAERISEFNVQEARRAVQALKGTAEPSLQKPSL